MNFAVPFCARGYSIVVIASVRWLKRSGLDRGCGSIALLDLKQSEAEKAAEELVEFAGTCLRLQSPFL
jgi:hypothetical protein